MMNQSRRRLLLENRIYITFAAVCIAALVFAPEIRDFGVAWNVLAQSSIIGIVAVGLTLVILAGQLDLSVGSVVTLAGVIALGQQGTIGIWPAIGMAVLASVAVGCVNGIIVVKAGVNSFIGTLATMIGVQGLAFVVSGGAPTVGIDPAFGALVDTAAIGPLTPRMLAFVAVALVAHVIVTRTAAGRNLLAVGGAPDVARLSGISSSARWSSAQRLPVLPESSWACP
jgi:ribose transport system permease protein